MGLFVVDGPFVETAVPCIVQEPGNILDSVKTETCRGGPVSIIALGLLVCDQADFSRRQNRNANSTWFGDTMSGRSARMLFRTGPRGKISRNYFGATSFSHSACMADRRATSSG